MYNAFYELQREPFHVTPDPEFLFPSPAHKEALAAIIYGIEQRKGFVAITGEVGVGKTTILRSYLDFADRQNLKLIYIYNSALSFDELVTTLLQELGVEARPPSTFQAVTLLHEALIEVYRKNQTVVLIIDEAQNMPVETLESLRMLSNLETVTEKLIQIMLIGQPEFDELLQQHRLRQLRQRIAIHARIGPLNVEDSVAYLEHRIAKVALGSKPVFTRNALKLIAEASEGVPRNLNILSDNALITGYGYQVRPVNTKIVKEVLADRGFVPAAAQPAQAKRRQVGLWSGVGLAAAAVVALVIAALALQPDLLRRGEREVAQVQPPSASQTAPQPPRNDATPAAPARPAEPPAPSRAPEPPPPAAAETSPPVPPTPPRVAGNPPVERPQLLDRRPAVTPPVPPLAPSREAAAPRRDTPAPAPAERPQTRQPAAPTAQPAPPPPAAAPAPAPQRPAEIARAPSFSREVESAPAPDLPAPPAQAARPAPAPAPTPAPPPPSIAAAPPPAPEPRTARSGSVEATAPIPPAPAPAPPAPPPAQAAAPVPPPAPAQTAPAARRTQGPIPLAAPPRPATPPPTPRTTPSIAAAQPEAPLPAPAPAPLPSVMMPSASGSGVTAPPPVEVASASQVARPLPTPPPPSSQTVKAVRAGDSLWTMAEEVYGFVSPSVLRRVQDANPQIRNFNVLAPGQEVVFPRVQESPFDRGTALSESVRVPGRN